MPYYILFYMFYLVRLLARCCRRFLGGLSQVVRTRGAHIPVWRPESVLEHYVAHAGVVLEAIHGHVLAVARVLHAAVRHLADQHEMRVDPGAAVLQARGQAVGAADITGPHRRGQAVVGVVGEGEGLRFVTEWGDTDHWTED